MCKPDITKSYNTFKSGIDIYINKMSQKLSLPKSTFNSWKSELLKDIDRQLKVLTSYKYNKVLGNEKIRKELDKAANNVSLVCKSFYNQMIVKELSSDNFTEEQHSVQDVVSSSLKYMKNNKLYVPNNHHKLPFTYWMPKMHKSAVGLRYITSLSDTINSTLSSTVGIALETLLKTEKNVSKYKSKFKSYKDYFIVDNRNEILEYISCHNRLNYRKTVKYYDFSNLYTSIPHNILNDSMSKSITKVFNVKSKTYITVTKNNAYFANKRSKGSVSFTCQELIKHIKFIVENSFVV